jgi:rhodanese-related sulfurtransferase
MKNISPAALRFRLAGDVQLNLLDVREPAEREEFNLGGIFIPLGQLMTLQIDLIEDKKDEEIICYCRSGKRSLQAAMMLETIGFTNVVNLEGGIMAWQAMQP